jgi:hypothetical protein
MTTTESEAMRAYQRALRTGGKSEAEVEETLERNRQKAAALKVYSEVLHNVELPPELVAMATVEDLQSARKSLMEHVSGVPKAGDNPEVCRAQRAGWLKAQARPDVLLETYAIPFLRAAINARLDAGVEVTLHVPGYALRQLGAAGLLPAGCADPKRVAGAVASAAQGYLERATQPQHHLDPTRGRMRSYDHIIQGPHGEMMAVADPEELRASAARRADTARRLEPVLTVPGTSAVYRTGTQY